MSLEIKTLVVGPFQCNCSVIVCKQTKEAIVIDAGDEFPKIKKALTDLGANVVFSVATHAHLDHIGAFSELKSFSPKTQIALHRDDEFLYKILPDQGRMFGFSYDMPPLIDRYLQDEEEIQFGQQKFSVIHTPGHSPGGICLRFEAGSLGPEPVVFSGDTLFRSSIGRTDLWGADHSQLIKSIKQRLLTFDDQTRICPGHGPNSSVGLERRENPFL